MNYWLHPEARVTSHHNQASRFRRIQASVAITDGHLAVDQEWLDLAADAMVRDFGSALGAR